MLLSKEVSEMLSLKDEEFNSRFLIDVMQHSKQRCTRGTNKIKKKR